ncbi:hypothetical protein EON66_07475 [archaeon]|nr:MAG: hypothetical protein EON66_07475 [archaeon]
MPSVTLRGDMATPLTLSARGGLVDYVPSHLDALPDILVSQQTGLTVQQVASIPHTAPREPKGNGRSRAASASHPPASSAKPLVLSPLSAEACLREGVDPDDLRPRPLDHFMLRGTVSKHIAQLVRCSSCVVSHSASVYLMRNSVLFYG